MDLGHQGNENKRLRRIQLPLELKLQCSTFSWAGGCFRLAALLSGTNIQVMLNMVNTVIFTLWGKDYLFYRNTGRHALDTDG